MRGFLGRNARTVVVAIVAAVIASVATAGAASLITGTQIKDGSISAKDLNAAVRAQLAKAGAPGATGAIGPQGPAGAKGDPGVKGDQGAPGPSTGSAGGDLAGSYPDPTLRPPELVGIKQQPPAPAAAINCTAVFDTFCGNANTGNYWKQSTNPAHGQLSYDVEPSGFVQMEGVAAVNGTVSSPSTVFTLPPGRRPRTNVSVSIPDWTSPANHARALVLQQGDVIIIADALTSGSAMDLSGVRFRIGG